LFESRKQLLLFSHRYDTKGSFGRYVREARPPLFSVVAVAVLGI